jgi:hypothetical protein
VRWVSVRKLITSTLYNARARARAAAPVMAKVPSGEEWEAAAAALGLEAPLLVEEALCEARVVLDLRVRSLSKEVGHIIDETHPER